MLQCNTPVIKEVDIKRVEEQLRSGNLAQGQRVLDLESKMLKIVKREKAAAYSSATAAFDAVFKFIELEEGDDVILSPLTFKSVPYSVIRTGATPVFIDTTEYYLCDWSKIDTLISHRTKAIIVTSLYGMPDPDFETLAKVLDLYPDIWIIEDNAQSIGAMYDQINHIGSFSSRADFAIFSFYATKNIAAGEGGIILFDEETDFFHEYRNNGIVENYFNQICIGTNMRMTDVEASLALSQIERLKQVTKIRNNQANIYSNIINIQNQQILNATVASTHAFHHYTLTLPQDILRDSVIERLAQNGIKAGVYYDYLTNYDRRLGPTVCSEGTPNAFRQSKQAICLPLGESLNHSDIKYIAQKFEEIVSSESATKQ